MLKSVASAEPNTVLQYIMLLYAQKEESLAKEQVLYRERVHELKEMLDTWSKLIITPIRVSVLCVIRVLSFSSSLIIKSFE